MLFIDKKDDIFKNLKKLKNIKKFDKSFLLYTNIILDKYSINISNIDSFINIIYLLYLNNFDINIEIKNKINNLFYNFLNIFENTKVDKYFLSNLLKNILFISDKLLLNKDSNLDFFFNIILNKLNSINFDNSLVNKFLKILKPLYNKSFLYNIIKLNNLIKIEFIDDQKYEYINNDTIYYSIIMRTNYIEELKYKNIMGLLININPNNINKLGYNLNFIQINSISNTIISLDEILDIYISNNNVNYDNIINDYNIGYGNCLIPLFINKYHWNIVKLYNNFNYGFIFNRNIIDYHIDHKNIYLNILLQMINMTIRSINVSDKWINILISVLRTTYENFINYDSIIDKFKNDIKIRCSCNINKILYEYIIYIKNDEEILNIIFEEIIRRSFKIIYKDIDILDKLINIDNFNFDDYKFKLNYNELNNWIMDLEKNKVFSNYFTIFYGAIIFNKIYKIINFDEFDKNNGMLDIKKINEIKEILKNNKLVQNNLNLKFIMYDKFKSDINTTKIKIYKINNINKYIQINDIILGDLLIQSLIQRVDKSRINAIKNNIYNNPFEKNNIIENTSNILVQRFLKKKYKLNDLSNYIKTINNIDINFLNNFCIIMIYKTISVKKYLLNNIDKIDQNRQKLINIGFLI